MPFALAHIGKPEFETISTIFGDPVNTATGNYVYQRRDIEIPGIGMPHNDFTADPLDVIHGFQIFADVLSDLDVILCLFNRLVPGLDFIE